jgi:hypothetical protein
MTVGGREFTSDLIIHADGRIQDNWRRAHGHSLFADDISTVLDSAPKKLVIGTGYSGMMSVSDSVPELCRNRGIELEVCRTAEAMIKFNESSEAGTFVAACFHLTC